MTAHEVNLSSTFKIPAHVLSRQVGDEVVILELASGTYFGLDQVGSRIWQLLGTGKTLGETCDVLVSEFDVALDEMRRDALELADKLRSNDLLILC